LLGLRITAVNHPDEFGVVNKSFTLICNKSTDDPVSWWYRRSPDAEIEHISFGDGSLLNGYKERCQLDGDDLIFNKLEPNDAGTYTCIEKAGHGLHHITYLNVSGKLKTVLYWYRLHDL